MSSRLTSETGRVLGGRYRLVAPVGVGTSSRVFLAVDTQLRRRVAVKLLHEALAEDEAFLRRFRAEARAASALSHPNILAVFDWGEDRSGDFVVPYLVTEYLGGGSLRDILDRSAPLTPSQALVVGLDAARALAHAHKRGLVHRDVKPANLLFDEDGRLRLADFGLARALAEASWTEPSGIAAGTARYSSPEQALGRRLDGRSDVYSLALVLVECATGSVPFAGETTAATLTLRTQGDLELGPELGGLRSVLERAGRLDPDERPEAAEFEIGLMAAAEELERPAPLPVVPTLGDGEQTSQFHLVASMGAVNLIDADVQVDEAMESPSDPQVLAVPPPVVIESADVAGPSGSALRSAGEPGSDAPGGPVDPAEMPSDTPAAELQEAAVEAPASQLTRSDTSRSDTSRSDTSRSDTSRSEEQQLLSQSRPISFGPVDPATGIAAPLEVTATTEEPTRRRGARRIIAVLVVIALVAACVAGWWFLVRVPVHDVPNLVGVDVATATRQAEDLGWTVDDSVTDRKDGSVAGQVLAQDPGVGDALAEGEVVRLTVSLGPTLAVVPAVTGVPEADAAASLTDAGFTVGAVSRAFDEDVPVDAVISAAPAAGARRSTTRAACPRSPSSNWSSPTVLRPAPCPRASRAPVPTTRRRRWRRCSWRRLVARPRARSFPRGTSSP